MENAIRRILIGDINVDTLTPADLETISGLSNLSAADQQYLRQRILATAYTRARDGHEYAIPIPRNVRLANLITYNRDSLSHEQRDILYDEVLRGQLEPMEATLTPEQLLSIASFMSAPVYQLNWNMSLRRQIATLANAIRNRIQVLTGRPRPGGLALTRSFDVTDEELGL